MQNNCLFKNQNEDSPRILIVDDETAIRVLLKQILESREYTVFEARGGKEALQLFRDEPVDLVLSDVNMPGLSGVQLLKAIKEINPRVPVVLVSGYHDIKTVVEALKAGADNFLTKPLHLKELTSIVELSLSLNCIRLAANDHLLGLAQKTTMKVPSNSHWIKEVVNQIALSSVAVGYCRHDLNNNLKLALMEALSNAMEHGNQWDINKLVTIEAEICNNSLEVIISDEGSGFDHDILPDPTAPENLYRERGRGVFLMRSIMDEILYEPPGNRIILRRQNQTD